jgi:outer membrane protein assembly factor BamB
LRVVADRDPDAIWRPGYAGEVVWRPPPRHRPPSKLLVIAGVAVAAAGVLTVIRITGGGTPRSLARGPIPTGAAERWTVTLDASSVAAVTGDEDTIVAAIDPQPRLVAFDVDSGAQRWRASVPDESLVSLRVVDGVVVADYLDRGGDQSLIGFDLDDGRELWRASVANGRGSLAGHGLIVPRSGAGRAPASVELLDPATGTAIGSIEADGVSVSSTSVSRRTGDVVEWYDPDTFERRGRLDLGDLDLERLDADVVPTAAGLVVAAPRRVLLVDASGVVTSSVRVPAQVDGPTTLDELDGSGRFVVLQGATDTTMLSVRDGRLDVLWTRSARVVDWLIDDSRQLVAILPWGDQPGAYDVGAPWMELVDATTGRPIWAGRLSRAVDGAFDVLGGNGFVAAGALVGGGAQSVAGYDFDGTELWRHPVCVGGRPLTLVPGGLVIVRTTTSGTPTLTLLS